MTGEARRNLGGARKDIAPLFGMAVISLGQRPRNYAALIFCIWQRTLPVFRAYRAWPALTYPSRPITMVVPFPIGGPTDYAGADSRRHGNCVTTPVLSHAILC